jgi:hypothetical protein
VTVLVGGVGQLYQGDLDLGRLAVERLTREDLGPGVRLEDLHYGALAVGQLLEDLRPSALVLVGAERRGRPPGAVERRRIHPREAAPEELQRSVESAGVGYVSIDLVVEVAGALGVLPARTVAVEVEPMATDPSERLSDAGGEGLEEALRLVRAELGRLPLLELADRLRTRAQGEHLAPAPALVTLRALLRELRVLDEAGRWGQAFALAERLRLQIAAGDTGEGMDHLDWGLWWGLLEELERLGRMEAADG